MVDPGDAVLLETPLYAGVLPPLRALNAELVGGSPPRRTETETQRSTSMSRDCPPSISSGSSPPGRAGSVAHEWCIPVRQAATPLAVRHHESANWPCWRCARSMTCS